MMKRALLMVAVILVFTMAASPMASAARIDQNCTASVQNQIVRVNPNGTFAIPNVPVAPGLYRIRVVCKNPDGTTYTLASPFVALVSNGITTISQLSPGSFSPIPVSLEVLAPSGNTGLTTNGQTAQLTVRGLLPDGSFSDLTPRSLGTTYTSSNSRIASVSDDGLVTAVSHGRAIITVRNEGVTGSIIMDVLSPLDTDGDGMPDDWEIANGLNPNDPSDAGLDPDSDGLTNLQEYRLGTNPHVADTDGDGINDGDEVRLGTNPLNPDSDGDGLLDGQEVRLGTNPLLADTDGDGIPDGIEVQTGLNPLTADPITTVQGRILDNNGSPIAGASAVAFRFFVGTTDATGLFTIQNVPAGLGNIIVSAQFIRPGQVLDGNSAPTAPVAAGLTDVGTFQLIVDSGAVTGLVTNPAGLPVPGALVNVLSGTTLRTATADSGGIYRVSNSVAGPLVVTATDPRTGLRGRATGVLMANQSSTVNVQLGPSGSITGTVYLRNGRTPAGSGVIVRLNGGAQVQTDGFGRYLFDFVNLGGYTLEASDSDGNRGRSSISILSTGQAVTVDITFLGRGSVSGSVLDGDGNPVANVAVNLSSQSVFGGSQNTSTDGNGAFSFSKVFIGDFSLSAQDSIGHRAGNASGHIDSEEQSVTGVNITLTSVGSIAGTVHRVDGSTPVAGARVTLSNGLATTADSSGRYRFDLIPVGGYIADATDLTTGDRGRSNTITISTQDQVANGDVNLIGQGTVVVTVLDGGGTPVSGASVSLVGQTQFGGSQTGSTGSDGTVTFARVLAGGFTVSATNPATALSGSASGSVAANANANITVNLQGAGALFGTVHNPDGTSPAPGISVRIYGQVNRSLRSNADGSYRFDGVPTGNYTLQAYDGYDNLRAQATATITNNGDAVQRDLRLIGVGTVTGTVRYPDGTAAGGLGVNLISSLPGYGRSFATSTNVNGVYSFPQVPVGPFSATSSRQTSSVSYYGTTVGQLSQNGQTVTADINLSESLIPLNFGLTLFDGNGYPYDIKGNGSLDSGFNNAFVGANADRGAMLLTIDKGGATTAFDAQSMGMTSHNGRQVEITQPDLGGLSLTRKIFVPSGGYFTRYLEVFSNPTSSPITFNLKIAHNIRQLNGFPHIVTTSSGDNNLDVSDPYAPDKWVVTEDPIEDDPFTAGGIPALAFLFDGPNGSEHTAAASFTTIGAGLISYEWDSITLAPGETAAYMHFLSQQTNPAAGTASAQRLAQLPPESITTFPSLASQFDALVNSVNTMCNAFQSSLTLGTFLNQCRGVYADAFNTNTTVQALLTGNSQDRNSLRSAATDIRTKVDNIRSFANAVSFQLSLDPVVYATAQNVRQALPAVQDAAGDYLDLMLVRNFSVPLNSASALDVLPAVNARIQGRVISNDRITGIPGTLVQFKSANLFYQHYIFARSDANGAFSFSSVPGNIGNPQPIPYADFTLIGTHPQFGTNSPVISGTVDATTGVGQADVVFTNAGSLTGLVRRAAGDVVSDGQVTVSGSTLVNGPVTTGVGSDGRYGFFAMPAGTVTLVAQLAHPQGTALVGSTIATITSGSTTTMDILLQPTGTVSGSVTRDNGNAVINIPVVLHAPNFSRTATTDTGGHFTLTDVPTGAFLLDTFDQATNTADSAQLTVSANTTTVQNLSLRLGGTVTGVVRNGNVPVATVQVVLQAANGTSAATTDANGVYRFDHVPPGNVSVQATDPASHLHGTASGGLGLSGQTVQLDMTLFAAGNVSGVVYRADGVTPVAGAGVTLTRSNYQTYSTTANNAGQFSLALIPIGSFTLDAVDNATGDRGRTSNQINANDENRVVNVQMVGFGTVQVTVRDAGDAVVPNANVTLYSQTTFGGAQSATTDNNGVHSFSNVFTGSFYVSATDPVTGLGGNANGTVNLNTVANITVHLSPAGTITGRVLAANGSTPVGGAHVRASGPTYKETDSAPDGSFRFPAMLLGTYSLDVLDSNGRVRDRESGVVLHNNGDIAVRNLVFIGQGTVQGHVLNPDSTPSIGSRVTVRSLNATLGGFFDTTTDDTGFYSVTSVPVGRFTATGNPGGQTSGETTGQITAEGQIATADIQLLNNSVSLPWYHYDGNDFYFDVQGDGRLYQGMSGVFAGDYGSNNGASVLTLNVGGTDTPFPSASIGYTEDEGREVAITQQNIGGIDATRKIFVPRDGYFARYLEILRNPTSSDITLNFKLTDNFYCYTYYYSYCSNIFRTSSGGTQLSVSDPNNPDRWYVTEDGYTGDPFQVGGFPATAFIFDGDNGALHPTTVSNGSMNVSYYYQPRYATYEWDNVVVPAGQSVMFMHFAVQETTTAAAIAAAQRLSQLPPEALVGLSAEEIAGVRNMAVPADGASTVPALPPLNGSVSGRVLGSDDGLIVGAPVQLTSTNLLYSRIWSVNSDNSGVYQVNSNSTNEGSFVTLPVDSFTVSARHPVTQVQSPTGTGTFPAGQNTAQKDVIFSNTGVLSGTVRFYDASPVLVGGSISMPIPGRTVNLNINSDGTYYVSGLPTGTFTATASVPTGNGGTIRGSISVIIVAGQTTHADIVLPATGAITGVVTNGAGTPMPSLYVYIDDPGFDANTLTDNNGSYTFAQVPTGTHTVRVYEPFTGVPTSATTGVTAGSNNVVNLQLIALGTVNLSVTYNSGSPAANASVYLRHLTIGNYDQYRGSAGSDGTLVVAHVPTGNFTLKAYHPSNGYLYGTVDGSLATDGQTINLHITLPATGVISGHVTRPHGEALYQAYVQAYDQNSNYAYAYTDSTGNYTLTQVPGNRPITVDVRHPLDNAIRNTGTVQIDTDGQNVTHDVVMPALATVHVSALQADDTTPATGVSIQIFDSVHNYYRSVGSTDNTGHLDISNVPQGNFTVRNSSVGVAATATGTVTATDDLGTVNITIHPPIQGNVHGFVYAADGATPVSGSYIQLRTAAGDNLAYTYSQSNGSYAFNNIALGPGGFTVTAYTPSFSDSVTGSGTLTNAGDTANVNLTLPLSVISGAVHFSDGTAVPYPSVFATYLDQLGSVRTIYGTSNQDGTYRLLGVPVGNFTVFGQDSTSGLTGSTDGALADAATPLTGIDVALPNSVRISGHLYRSDGSPENGSVTLANSNLQYSQTAYVGGDGSYSFDHVAEGPFVLQGYGYNTGYYVTRSGAASLAEGDQVIDLTLPDLGVVSGTVYQSDGITPVQNARVILSDTINNGPNGWFQTSTNADSNGNYAVNFPLTNVLVEAYQSNTAAGRATGQLTSTTTALNLNVVFGNAGRFVYNLDGADGFRYDTDCDGEFDDGGTVDRSQNDGYDGAYYFSIGYNWYFNCHETGALEMNGRQIVIGPERLRYLDVKRKIYVPAAGGFARSLTYISNPTNVPVTESFTLQGNLGSDSSTQVTISPSNTNGSYAASYQGNSTEPYCCDPALAHVFGGDGLYTGTVQPSNVNLVTGNDNVHADYQVTIPAGGTVIIMNFFAQRMWNDPNAAASAAAALATLSDPAQLDGMSAEEKAQVVNFTIPASGGLLRRPKPVQNAALKPAVPVGVRKPGLLRRILGAQ